MNILISYDGSSCANDAIRELKRAALPDDSNVLLFSVAEKWQAPVGPGGLPIDVSELADEATALKQAEEGRVLARELFPNWTLEADGQTGSIAPRVINRADRFNADLIVVGSHGLNAVERFVFGSVSQQLVTSAHCSVRVARGTTRTHEEPIRLLLAVDGSEDSNGAFESLLARPWPENTKVWLATSVGSYFEDDANSREREQFLKMHEKMATRLREKGLNSASIIDHVDPKYMILEKASEFEVDTIFLGARGLTRFERTLLGSVSASVSARAKCSVEILRH